VSATITLAAITVDCPDPAALAAFYQAAAGAEAVRGDADSAWARMAGTLWIFRKVADFRAPTWPSSEVPMQVHMEFSVDELEPAAERLRELGATVPEHQPGRAGGLLVLLDPAGHPFCIGAR
jgi:hypothetical protein